MKRILVALILAASLPLVIQGQAKKQAKPKGVLLEDLTWMEAEKILTPETVVVIPLGAASKEHGPHLKLNNDWLMAEYLKRRVLNNANIVMAPTIPYHFYPAFLEYPGSTSLRLETARDLVVDVCRSLSRYGPRRFYVINAGISTVYALKPAAEMLATDGILLRYSDLKMTEPVEKTFRQQEGGTHADEIETSVMLYIAPARVEMKKAVKDYHPRRGPMRFTRNPDGEGVYSPTGTWGDPTLATRGKGKVVVEALVAGMLKEIEELRQTPISSP